ncbi:DUF1592 domain-containing protein [Sphingomonadales bacterium 56]|uniref:DUF1592 domain-containing protein n=1 Tax=unclassified Sphingobium TaxID=2611147 RepID=UPI0019189B02|nr:MULTISPECIES: DUF1592 domain-containing protein [unclassified Sphingobium]MBY2929696.1 DUF1592 domain-containing protein [Sphingomonadales bacterium 56]MBY2960121.1 DUF1592 domain-containing protein [Sphingomonadales bacterium 58]CAD7340011.1 hypothetical protein SPHS6_02735 [Sphingobium sp. S6]CAD7340413.1 hypothetical protein SPHS8_03098 [Sphingobium sp. S8]
MKIRALPSLALAGACLTLGLSIAFSGARADESHADTPPSQIRRLTESQYRNVIADVFGPDIKIVGRFEPDLRIDGLQAVGTSAVSVTAAGLEQYENLARSISAQVTDEQHRAKLVGCAPTPADQNGAACARQFFQRVGLQLYRRPLSDAEVTALTKATTDATTTLGDFHAGLAATLSGMLTSPEFLFRIDRPAPSRRNIDAWSKASRLSFLFWNSMPDQTLLDEARSGALDTQAGLTKAVDRLIASPRFEQGVRAFFTDYLRLDGMDELAKDSLIYPAFSQAISTSLREQTLRTISWFLVERKGDYRDLFTARSIAMNRSLGPIYDIPVSKADWFMYEFPQGDPRSGLLTHASMLAQHSHPGRTSPTLRGVALREIFLCEKIPAPPANVNFAVVQNVDNPTLKTTRARLQAHLDDEECASCHRRTDPIGLGLEQFDGAGQFRKVEHDEVIDVSGDFEKQAFNGAAALGQLFRNNPRVSSCLVQSAWRYANGRNPSGTDGAEIAKLDQSFAAGGHRFPLLMRAIALDPAFYTMPRLGPERRVATVRRMKETG